jgi:enoyl-CoA hydratase/carnithine racemase
MTVPALELTQFTVTEPAPGYWRATFDHPPTNLMNAVTAVELRAIVEAAEGAGDLRVLVLDSASAEYFFALRSLGGAAPP